jgi:hypothetical protein
VELGALVAVACISVALVSLSCGSEDADRPERAEALPGTRHLVTEQQIRSTRQDAPERAVLEWFQAVQFKDVPAVRALVRSEGLRRVSSERVERAVHLVGGALGRPRVSGVIRRGSSASVRVLVLSYERGKADPVLAVPVTFVLRRDTNEWLLEDLDYLLASADAMEEARDGGPP